MTAQTSIILKQQTQVCLKQRN